MIGLWLFADKPAAGGRLRCHECRSEIRRGDAKVLRSVGGGLVCLVSCYECGHERRIPMPDRDSEPPRSDVWLEHGGQRTLFEGGAS